MGGCIPFLKAARTLCPRIMPPLLLLSAFLFLVNVLGGAPGHNPDRRTKMISIHSLSELERLKLQETAYHELVARHFLSEFKPDRGEPAPERGVPAFERADPRAGRAESGVQEGGRGSRLVSAPLGSPGARTTEEAGVEGFWLNCGRGQDYLSWVEAWGLEGAVRQAEGRDRQVDRGQVKRLTHQVRCEESERGGGAEGPFEKGPGRTETACSRDGESGEIARQRERHAPIRAQRGRAVRARERRREVRCDRCPPPPQPAAGERAGRNPGWGPSVQGAGRPRGGGKGRTGRGAPPRQRKVRGAGGAPGARGGRNLGTPR